MEARVFEIRVRGEKERVARLLCRDEFHAPPCEVPWSLSSDEDGTLVVGVFATAGKAAEVAERLGAVSVAPGDPERFDGLEEQYRIESRLR